MDGATLEKLLKLDILVGAKFGGLYCSDQLEYPLKPDKIYVINESPSTHPLGTHWQCIHTCRPRYVEFLCSADARYQDLPHVKKCLEHYSDNIYSFPRRVQVEWSSSCALFVLWHAWCVSRRMYGPDIVERFYTPVLPASDLYKQDIMVSCLVETLFHLPKGQSQQLILDVDFLGEQLRHEEKKRRRQRQRRSKNREK